MEKLASLLAFAVLLCFPAFAYLPAQRGGPAPCGGRFPTRREGAALPALVLLAAAAGQVAGGLLSSMYLAPVGLFLLLYWGFFLPPFVAGLAGRRPFTWGAATATLCWTMCLVSIRLAHHGREWSLAPDWVVRMLPWWPVLLMLGALGCLPVYLIWKRRAPAQ